MNTCIVINEECHGFIGVAKDYQSAIDFLIADDWLTENTEFVVDTTLPIREWKSAPVKELFGENWVEALKNLDDPDDFFDGSFYFSQETIYGAE